MSAFCSKSKFFESEKPRSVLTNEDFEDDKNDEFGQDGSFATVPYTHTRKELIIYSAGNFISISSLQSSCIFPFFSHIFEWESLF